MQIIKFVYTKAYKIKAVMQGLSQVDSITFFNMAHAKNNIVIALKKIIYPKSKVSESVAKNSLDSVAKKGIKVTADAGVTGSVGVASKKIVDGLSQNNSVVNNSIRELKIARAGFSSPNIVKVSSSVNGSITSFLHIRNSAGVRSSVGVKMKYATSGYKNKVVAYHEIDTQSIKSVTNIYSEAIPKNSINAAARYYETIRSSSQVIVRPIEMLLNKLTKLKDLDNKLLKNIDNLTLGELEKITIEEVQ